MDNEREAWIEGQIRAMRLDGITADAAILRVYLETAYEKGQADAHPEQKAAMRLVGDALVHTVMAAVQQKANEKSTPAASEE